MIPTRSTGDCPAMDRFQRSRLSRSVDLANTWLTFYRLLTVDPNDLVKAALGVFLKYVQSKFDEIIKARKGGEQEGIQGEKSRALWRLLMRADHMSVRQFLGS